MEKKRWLTDCILITFFFMSALCRADVVETAMKNLLVYVISPTMQKILPDTKLSALDLSDDILTVVAPGEYEAASFVVRPEGGDLPDLKVSVGELKDEKGGVIPASVDVKVVKCWYQGGGDTISFQNVKVFTPELLLNDDTLVKVDTEQKENYVRVVLPSGEEKYMWTSWKDKKERDARYPEFSKGYKIKDDAPSLLPVNVSADTNKQFWLTLRVPPETRPGKYSGTIVLSSGGKQLRTLTLKIRVLPVKLQPVPIMSSVVHVNSRLDPASTRFRMEYRDFAEHGIRNMLIARRFDEDAFTKILELRKEAGLNTDTIFFAGQSWDIIGNPTEEKALNELKAKVSGIVEFCRTKGVKEVYFIGMDESAGDLLRSQRPAWQAVHEAGGKVFLAAFGGTFDVVGDLLDLFISCGAPSEKEAEKWHGKGHRIWCYANPQGGVENPETYRRNYGLLLYQKNYDGFFLYADKCGMYDIWNDFDHPLFRDHAMLYPTENRDVSTIQWEGLREGMDDIRYVEALKQLIAEGKKNAEKKETACDAEKWLAELDVENRNLDSVRYEMFRYILKLEKGE